MTQITGIDVSHYNIVHNYDDLQGIGFAIIKATQKTFTDPKLVQHANGFNASGVLTGFYHFFDSSVDAHDQAVAFVNAIKPFWSDYSLLVALDLEEIKPVLSPKDLCAAIHVWLDYVESQLNRVPFLYIGKFYVQEQLGGTTEFSQYPLWLSSYTSQPNTPFYGWESPQIWQYSDKFLLQNEKTDGDIFYGSVHDLWSLVKGKPLCIGVTDEKVKAVQKAIGVIPDGIFRGRTLDTLNIWQHQNGLPLTDNVDSQTWEKLFKIKVA